MSEQIIKKAIIPVAGKGTRLLPLTKYLPKELLPVGNRPVLQHVMEMYLDAGIREFCIIISPEKPAIEHFLTGNFRDAHLPYAPDLSFFQRLHSCRLVFHTQSHPMGVADAVSLARDFVGSEPFGCVMPDCLLFSQTPFLKQLMASFSKYRKNTIGTVWIGPSEAKRYGNVGLLDATPLDDTCFSIHGLSGKTKKPLQISGHEKVQKGFGGGIYLPEYFDWVEVVRSDAVGEVDDVPIHNIFIQRNALVGVPLHGTAFDCGHPLGYRAAAHHAGRPAGSIHQGSEDPTLVETTKA